MTEETTPTIEELTHSVLGLSSADQLTLMTSLHLIWNGASLGSVKESMADTIGLIGRDLDDKDGLFILATSIRTNSMAEVTEAFRTVRNALERYEAARAVANSVMDDTQCDHPECIAVRELLAQEDADA